jgi:hypothetical protein
MNVADVVTGINSLATVDDRLVVYGYDPSDAAKLKFAVYKESGTGLTYEAATTWAKPSIYTELSLCADRVNKSVIWTMLDGDHTDAEHYGYWYEFALRP